MLPSQTGPKAPSRVFYGWIVVAVCLLTQIIPFGVHLSFGIFFDALLEAFGWSRAETSLIFSVSLLMFILLSTPISMALNQFGARPVFVAGLVSMIVGLSLSSLAQAPWHLYLSYGVLVGSGLTCMNFGPQALLLSKWFRRRRGMAIGIVFSGTGLGSFLMNPVLALIIERVGWRAGYLTLAGIIVLVIPVVILFIRDSPAEVGQFPDGDHEPGRPSQVFQIERQWTARAVLQNPAFWLLALSAIVTMGPLRVLTIHQFTALGDVGIPRTVAAGFVSTAGLAAAVAFVTFGTLSDRIGRLTAFAIGSVSLIGAFALLGTVTRAEQTGLLLVYAFMLGVGEGSRASLVSATANDLFAGPQAGLANGATTVGFSIGSAIFPWTAGRIFDTQGSYLVAFIISGAAIAVSILIMWMAPRVVGHAAQERLAPQPPA